MTGKRRYTQEEITGVIEQLQNDKREAYERMGKIAKHIASISGMKAEVNNNEMNFGYYSLHIPYLYVSIPMCQYDFESEWLTKMLENQCKTPAAGIGIHTRGFMWSGDVPDVGHVEDIYVCISTYDAHAGGW